MKAIVLFLCGLFLGLVFLGSPPPLNAQNLGEPLWGNDPSFMNIPESTMKDICSLDQYPEECAWMIRNVTDVTLINAKVLLITDVGLKYLDVANEEAGKAMDRQAPGMIRALQSAMAGLHAWSLRTTFYQAPAGREPLLRDAVKERFNEVYEKAVFRLIASVKIARVESEAAKDTATLKWLDKVEKNMPPAWVLMIHDDQSWLDYTH